MINPKVIQTAQTVVRALIPFLYALAGGFMAGAMQKCQKPEPITLVVTNQQYEKQLTELHAKQDSIVRVLPTISESVRYLSDKYDKK